MQFNETHAKVLDKSKTQTRRIFKVGDCGYHIPATWDEFSLVENINGRRRFQVGQVFAVQTGRGSETVGRIRIERIRLVDVRQISDEDARAEGFAGPVDFLAVWCKLNDRKAAADIAKIGWQKVVDEIQALEYLRFRPDRKYRAWALTFCLHEGKR